eukprot:scaffold10016_cov170-Amphora_coffeaeformis.AAC.6
MDIFTLPTNAFLSALTSHNASGGCCAGTTKFAESDPVGASSRHNQHSTRMLLLTELSHSNESKDDISHTQNN